MTFLYRLAVLLGVLLAVLLAVLPAGAQVNTERLRIAEPEEGLGGELSFSLALQEGNTDTLDVGTGLRVQKARVACIKEAEGAPEDVEDAEPCRRYARRLVFLASTFNFSEENDRRSDNRTFAHLRWTQMPSPRLGYEAFVQYQDNEFVRLKERDLVGVGARWVPVRRPQALIAVGSGAMYEHERLDVPPGGPDDPEQDTVRWSNYLSVRWNLLRGDGDDPDDYRLLLVNTLYAQPRFERFEDYRLLDELELRIPVGQRLSLGFSLTVVYDSEPPADVKDTDLRLANQLTFRF